jgi:hypothetical protein
MDPTTRGFAVRLAAVPLIVVLLCPAARSQSGAPRPAVAVLNLRFDGEHANVLQSGDTAIVAAATSKLLATLAASERVTLVDSGAVAAAVAAAELGEGGGNPCDNACALAVARRLGARWVAKGTISNLSSLVWLLTAELLDASTGKPVLADSYEIKGDPARMAPAGAHVFAQRVERAIGSAR